MTPPVLAQERPGADASGEAAENSTIIYDQNFINQYKNAVSIIDIIRRIPGGQQILDSGGGDGGRGFSANDDRVLIDGKRLSGKSNDSESALGRITIDQVERIELIRGASPDVKTSSQDAIINIVLKPGAGGGSGSWRAKARKAQNEDRVNFGGFLSYGGSVGALEYFASGEIVPDQRTVTQVDLEFDGNGNLIRRLEESGRRNKTEYELTTNLIYNLANGDQIRLNGLYSDDNSFREAQPGVFFEPDLSGRLVEAGRSFRLGENDNPAWEIGGDYETAFADNLQFKILGLHSWERNTRTNEEDFDIAGTKPEVDFRSVNKVISTESIGRASLVWTASAAHEIEYGSELSLNKEDVKLQFFDRIDGDLVPRDVSAADVVVKETRNESFLIHTWKLNAAMSLESSIFSEYSRISQNGAGVSRSKTFYFIRPSTDFRYNITSRDQLQLSVRRAIAQLEFGDFASSVSDDDEIIAGNENLAPSKSWEFEASFEHRFINDNGSVKFNILNEQISDFIQRIEVAPGVSGVGNFGSARKTELELEANRRLAELGLPDFVVEASLKYRDNSVLDPFTLERRPVNFYSNTIAEISFRHDVNALGLSYGAEIERESRSRFFDIDERIVFSHPRYSVDTFIEKNIFWGMILRFDAFNLVNTNFGRDRFRFDNGVAIGLLTGRELRERRAGRRFELTLRGIF